MWEFVQTNYILLWSCYCRYGRWWIIPEERILSIAAGEIISNCLLEVGYRFYKVSGHWDVKLAIQVPKLCSDLQKWEFYSRWILSMWKRYLWKTGVAHSCRAFRANRSVIRSDAKVTRPMSHRTSKFVLRLSKDVWKLPGNKRSRSKVINEVPSNMDLSESPEEQLLCCTDRTISRCICIPYQNIAVSWLSQFNIFWFFFKYFSQISYFHVMMLSK